MNHDHDLPKRRLSDAARLLPLPFLAALLCLAPPASAGDASAPQGDPVLEPPTLRCLGVYWPVRGDDNQNARVELDYRKTGSTGDWRHGPPLFRVERRTEPYRDEGGEPRPPSKVQAPPDGWLFAGSLLLLDPDTGYELRLRLIDPDGGSTEKLLHARTRSEPAVPAGARTRHVVPGDGGGSGTAADPFKGLHAAQKSAGPGDVFLLHAGTYAGTFEVERNGEPGRPIVWRGAGDGEAVLDAQKPRDKLNGSVIEAIGAHDVWFEGLTLCNAYRVMRGHGAARLVVRRCHMLGCIVGINAEVTKEGVSPSDFFISDNLIEGFMPWPTTQQQWHDLPESRGIWIGGSGHVVCYNRIRHMKDAMDTADDGVCCAIDFHNNDVSEMFDDGSEMDGSERNTRNFLNRYTNTLTGVSLQPVYGGPVYVFRNVIYNCQTEAFKLHNSPSGGVLIHNTVVKNGPPLLLMTTDKVFHCVSRNNLFLGTEGRAMDYTPTMVHSDFDYDGFGGFSGPFFVKWNGVKTTSPEETHAKGEAERHCTVVDAATAFASGITPPADPKKAYDSSTIDLRLKPGSAAVDAGEVLSGFNDGYAGKAPDLGAYELGAELPQYGPRGEGAGGRGVAVPGR